MAEYIDVYDKHRNKTGEQIDRKSQKLNEDQYQLYVTALLQNTEGKFLITQRALDKKWAAGWWEVSGGGALAGETSLQAVIREVKEEVGLDISTVSGNVLYSYQNTAPESGDNYFNDIYLFVFDFSLSQVTLRQEEAIDCKMATWEEIETINQSGEFLHFSRIETALKNTL